ncbi:MAG: sensor histidine kinase [Planctomycetes bacterium]|nr:sensor histidine kinase [Planctomycetota bacterium]
MVVQDEAGGALERTGERGRCDEPSRAGLGVAELERLLRLSERELRLVGLELHDGAAQQLSAAVMFLDVAIAQLPDDPQSAKASVEEAARRARDAMRQMREVVTGIRPPALDQDGLAAALGEWAACNPFPSIDIAWDVRINSIRLMPTLELAAYRILQEALRNAQRHGRARRAAVTVVERDGMIVVEVRDDGCGFDRQKVPRDRLGLAGMEQRAEMVGGSCRIESREGGGTVVHAELPRIDRQLAAHHDVE